MLPIVLNGNFKVSSGKNCQLTDIHTVGWQFYL